MRKGITIIEIVIFVVLLAGIVLVIIPNLYRRRVNCGNFGASVVCTTIMSESETFRMSKGRLPKNTTDFIGRLDTKVLNATYDQNPNDALISTDGKGALKDVETYKSHKFIFLVKSIKAPNGTVDPMIRAAMVLPSRFDEGGENCYYRTNESGTTYLWSAAWELATNSPVSYADASGQPMYFKPAGPKSLHTSLVYEVNLSSTYFYSGN